MIGVRSKCKSQYFVKKISDLKKGIDKSKIVDPLEKLEKKMKNNTSKFNLKIVTEADLKNTLKKMKKKKSAGTDGLSQENLINGGSILASPLTLIINKSIEDGQFPTEWKEALVTPVLKKGDPKQLNNYRPVSCLNVASKVLETVVCAQMTDYLEKNHLLPIHTYNRYIYDISLHLQHMENMPSFSLHFTVVFEIVTSLVDYSIACAS